MWLGSYGGQSNLPARFDGMWVDDIHGNNHVRRHFRTQWCRSILTSMSQGVILVKEGSEGDPRKVSKIVCLNWTTHHHTFLQPSHGLGPKPSLIYSNYPFIQELYLPLPKDVEWTAEMSKKHLGCMIGGQKDIFPNIYLSRRSPIIHQLLENRQP